MPKKPKCSDCVYYRPDPQHKGEGYCAKWPQAVLREKGRCGEFKNKE
jgi:hypothetical protein